MALRLVNRRLFAECSRRGAILSAIMRSLTANIRKTPFSGYILTSFLLAAHCESKKKVSSFQDPDPSKLTQGYLLKSTLSQTSDTVTAALSQTARTIIDFEEKYREKVKMMINLLKYHLSVLGTVEEERIREVVKETELCLEKCGQDRKDLHELLSSVESLVKNAADVAQMTGANFISDCLGERLKSAKTHIEAALKDSKKLEAELQEVQAVRVRAIGELADEKEKFLKLQEDIKTFSWDSPAAPTHTAHTAHTVHTSHSGHAQSHTVHAAASHSSHGASMAVATKARDEHKTKAVASETKAKPVQAVAPVPKAVMADVPRTVAEEQKKSLPSPSLHQHKPPLPQQQQQQQPHQQQEQQQPVGEKGFLERLPWVGVAKRLAGLQDDGADSRGDSSSEDSCEHLGSDVAY